MDEATNPPPLKSPPRYGYYPNWPEDGDQWLHPEDVELARRVLPSRKIWRRAAEQGNFHGFHEIRHGDQRLRVKSVLWQEVAPPHFRIGDWIEVRTRLHTNEAHTGRVVDLEWDDYRKQIVYHIEENDQPIVNVYTADDLKPVAKPTDYQHSVLPADTPEATEGVDELVEGLDKDENFGPPWKD